MVDYTGTGRVLIQPPPGLLGFTYASEDSRRRVVLRGFLPASVELTAQERRELARNTVSIEGIDSSLYF
jgi:hypothetical protein